MKELNVGDLKKYMLVFEYADPKTGIVVIRSINPLLSLYIQSVQTALEAGILYRTVKDFIEKGSQAELRLPLKNGVLI